MWLVSALISGVLFYYLFSWYRRNLEARTSERAMIFFTNWGHATVWTAGLLLLACSIASCFEVSSWLIPVPLVALFLALSRKESKTQTRIDAVIKKTVVTHYELMQKGLKEPDIYLDLVATILNQPRERWRNLLGKRDWNLVAIIEHVILPETGLWNWNMTSSAHGMQDLIAMNERIKGYQDSFERLRAEHETAAQS